MKWVGISRLKSVVTRQGVCVTEISGRNPATAHLGYQEFNELLVDHTWLLPCSANLL